MKYKVIVHQNLKYSDNIVGYFDNLTEVQTFIETVLTHFENADVSIEVVVPKEEEEDE